MKEVTAVTLGVSDKDFKAYQDRGGQIYEIEGHPHFLDMKIDYYNGKIRFMYYLDKEDSCKFIHDGEPMSLKFKWVPYRNLEKKELKDMPVGNQSDVVIIERYPDGK